MIIKKGSVHAVSH